MLHSVDLLTLLVSLAEHHDGVDRAVLPRGDHRERDGLGDGIRTRATVDDLARPRRSGSDRLPGPGDDCGPDVGGILGARVVVGDHYDVGSTGRGCAHGRALATVAVAACTEDRDEPSGSRVP